MNLHAEIVQKDLSLLFEFIKDLEMEELYDSDLSSIKSKLNQFLVFKVTKKDLFYDCFIGAPNKDF